MECLLPHRLALSGVEKSYYIPEIFGSADSPSASIVLHLLCMPHGPNCSCTLCSARRSYLDCAARIIQRRLRARSIARVRAAIAQEDQAQEDEAQAAARRGDCYFCIICTLPQGECDICRDC